MKKVKIVDHKKQKRYNPISPRIMEFNKIKTRMCLENELKFYRHQCEDEWLEKLLEYLDIDSKKIGASTVRKIIIGSIRKRME